MAARKLRILNPKKVSEIKNKTFAFDGIWRDVFGTPEVTGTWLIYGKEKNGKTTFSLRLAKYISQFTTVLYVSAEEGFSENINRIIVKEEIYKKCRNLFLTEYCSFKDLNERINEKRTEKVIFIDNLSVYSDDLRKGGIYNFVKNHKKLFVFIAHQEGRQPQTSAGRLCKKIAKVIINVEGMRAFVDGRCPGGTMDIDKREAQLHHG